MYNFLLQEDWWMETIIASCITAVVTLIVSYTAYLGRLKDIENKLDNLNDEKYNLLREEIKNLSGGHKDLSAGHKDLSDEHKDLSGEHKDLSKEHRILKDEIHRVIVYQESEKTARETAAKKLPDESGLVKMVNAVFANNKKLLQKNMKLNARLEILQKENAQLKAQVRAFQNDREDSLEINDMDLFDELDDDMEL